MGLRFGRRVQRRCSPRWDHCSGQRPRKRLKGASSHSAATQGRRRGAGSRGSGHSSIPHLSHPTLLSSVKWGCAAFAFSFTCEVQA